MNAAALTDADLFIRYVRFYLFDLRLAVDWYLHPSSGIHLFVGVGPSAIESVETQPRPPIVTDVRPALPTMLGVGGHFGIGHDWYSKPTKGKARALGVFLRFDGAWYPHGVHALHEGRDTWEKWGSWTAHYLGLNAGFRIVWF